MFTKIADNHEPRRIYLQLFNDGPAGEPTAGEPAGGEPSAAPEGVEPGGEPAPEPQGDPRQQMQNPLRVEAGTEPSGEEPPEGEQQKGGEEPPAGEPSAPEPQFSEEVMKVIPDKFKNEDGSVNFEALSKSYSEMEKVYHKRGEENSNLKKQLEQRQTPKPGGKPEGEPETKPKPKTPEELEADNEKMLQEFYDNPGDFMSKMRQQAKEESMAEAMEQFKPVLQDHQVRMAQQRYSSLEAQVKDANEDFDQYREPMQGVIKEQGDTLLAMQQMAEKEGKDFNIIQTVYEIAKGRSAQPAQQGPSITEMLQDDEAIDLILKDENIRNKILKTHVDKVKSGGAPPVIGAKGGQPPASPPNEIKNTKDATKHAKAYFKQFGID